MKAAFFLLMPLALVWTDQAAAQQTTTLSIAPEQGAVTPSNVYFVVNTTAAGTTRRYFKRTNNIWSATVPATQRRLWHVRVIYDGSTSPDPVDLDLYAGGPGSEPVVLRLPRPKQRTDCHARDERELATRSARRAEPSDALFVVIQADNLLANVEEQCADSVAQGLKDLRGDNIVYLRRKIPYFANM